MRTVRQLLEGKASGNRPPEIFSVSPDSAVLDAIRLMAEKRIGAVLVMEGARLAGILSERDYARKVVLEGRSSKDTPVRPDDTTDTCMQLVTTRRIRHLPVCDGDDVVGVVSIGDLVKAVIEDQQLELDQLQRYIAS